MESTEHLRRRARTNWRRLLAWGLLVAAITVSLAFGFSANQRSIENHTIIKKQGSPCIELKNGDPSAGCYRLARLVFSACRKRPRICEAVLTNLTNLSPAGIRAFRRALRSNRVQARGRTGRPRPSAPTVTTPSPPTGGVSPQPPRGSPSQPSAPSPSPAPPAPTPKPPSPSDTINNTIEQGVNQGNATLCQVAHTCSVLPQPPRIPPLP